MQLGLFLQTLAAFLNVRFAGVGTPQVIVDIGHGPRFALVDVVHAAIGVEQRAVLQHLTAPARLLEFLTALEAGGLGALIGAHRGGDALDDSAIGSHPAIRTAVAGLGQHVATDALTPRVFATEDRRPLGGNGGGEVGQDHDHGEARKAHHVGDSRATP